jgi:hypothetical protein
MPNDTPFVPQPNRSPEQPSKDALLRGDDYAVEDTGEDQYLQAVAYGEHIKRQANGRARLLKMLTGSKSARISLEQKTAALRRHAPPHVIDSAGQGGDYYN